MGRWRNCWVFFLFALSPSGLLERELFALPPSGLLERELVALPPSELLERELSPGAPTPSNSGDAATISISD